MNKINKVIIGDKTYDILFEKDSEGKIQAFDPAIQGKIEYSEDKIYIYKHQSEEQVKRALFHEIIHGVNEFMGCNLNEEETIRISNGIRAMGKNNKELIKYIFNIK